MLLSSFCFDHLYFGHLNLFRISIFEFRIFLKSTALTETRPYFNQSPAIDRRLPRWTLAEFPANNSLNPVYGPNPGDSPGRLLQSGLHPGNGCPACAYGRKPPLQQGNACANPRFAGYRTRGKTGETVSKVPYPHEGENG